MRNRSSYSFGSVPMLRHSRSKFDLSFSHKTTLNVGDLVPLYVQEIYPGDSFRCDANVVARATSTFLKPVMDNLFCDVMFFFVPSRLLFSKWPEIFGENNSGPWASNIEVKSPTLLAGGPAYSVKSGDLANYLGIPVGVDNRGWLALDDDDNGSATRTSVSVLPFRAYAKIYNDWYRDENLVDPVHIQLGDTGNSEYLNGNEFSPTNYTGKCAKVAKMHDYFTQLLFSPQKSDAVQIGTSLFPASVAPVVTASGVHGSRSMPAMEFYLQGTGTVATNTTFDVGLYTGGSTSGGTLRADTASPVTSGNSYGLIPNNLVAEIPETALGSVSVNDLRFAFQLQKMYERDAIFGTRYTEYLQGHFGVTSPDARLQRSEFLGGRRFPLNVIQATQTSQPTEDSPLGAVAGWSLSNGRAGYTKGFTEHGFVIGMFCIRHFHSYQQGIERFWWRSKRTDFVDPIFSTIGYQPVFTKELYAIDVARDRVFGYAPAYEDCRCRQNRVSGQLSSAANTGLDIWTFADDYESAPVLGQQWIQETPIFVDRTLSVPSETVDNFIFDVFFKQYAIRCLPTFGMPGLIDHH